MYIGSVGDSPLRKECAIHLFPELLGRREGSVEIKNGEIEARGPKRGLDVRGGFGHVAS